MDWGGHGKFHKGGVFSGVSLCVMSTSKTLLGTGFKDLIFSSQSTFLHFSLIVFTFLTAVLAAESHLFGNFGGKCFVPVKIGKLGREIEVPAGPLVLYHQEQQLQSAASRSKLLRWSMAAINNSWLDALLSLPMRFGNVDTCMTQLTNRGDCWDEAPWSLRCLRCGSLSREKGTWACLNQCGKRVGASWEPLVWMGWGGAQEKQECSPGSIQQSSQCTAAPDRSWRGLQRGTAMDLSWKGLAWQLLEDWCGWSVENKQDHQLAGDVLLWVPTEGHSPCVLHLCWGGSRYGCGPGASGV